MRVYLCLAMLFICRSVFAGNVNFDGLYSIKVTSIVEQRFKNIYKQRYDFSCGSATLASLLSFHYDDVVNELSVFKDMFEHGNQEKIKHQGFSLLDMKHYLARRGYQANGFKISLEQLSNAQIPAITIINNNGYMHFVIIKASNDTEVLVGDPAIGLKTIQKDRFEEMWEKRIIFVIQDRKEIALNHYNNDLEWDHQIRADLGLAIDHSSLGLFNVLQPSSVDF